MKTAREFIKDTIGIELNFDNESDDCELEWTIIEDLMSKYAKYCKPFYQHNPSLDEALNSGDGVYRP